MPDGWNSIAVSGDGRGHYRRRGHGQRHAGRLPGRHRRLARRAGARPTPHALGIRPAQLRFTGRAETANGTVGLAPVTLRELRIGQLSRHGVAAVVNEAPMGISLLGMSFLDGLEGWEARGDRLLLYW